MKRARAWTLVLTAWSAASLLAACGRPPGDVVVIPETTKVLDAASVAALDSVTDDELRFSATTAQLTDLDAGDVIVASVGPLTPFGLLRSVTETTLDGDAVVVRTAPAGLEDAIDQATITLHRALERDDLLTGATSGIGFEEPATGLVIAFDDVPLNDAETIRASGSLVIEPTIDLSIRIGLTTGLEEVSFRFGATQGASLEIVGDDAATFDKETTIGAPLVFTPVVVDVGGLPVVFTPIVTFVVGGSGEATGSFSGSVRQQAEYSLGLAYEGGSFGATQSRAVDAQSDPPRISSSASATVYTGPRLEVLAYGIAGPHVEVDAYAQANARLGGSPTCLQWDLVAGLKGLVGFEFLLDYEDEVFDANERIAERSDCTDGDPASTWSRTYASDAQSVHSIQRTDDGGFVTAGYHMDTARNEPFGISVMRLDERGAVVWQRAYPYDVTGYPSAIRPVLGGGYVVASGGWATGSSNEAVLTRLDQDGNLLWAKSYGSDDGRPLWPQAIANHIDGRFTVAVAHGWSFDGGDVWVRFLRGGRDTAVEQDVRRSRLGPGQRSARRDGWESRDRRDDEHGRIGRRPMGASPRSRRRSRSSARLRRSPNRRGRVR